MELRDQIAEAIRRADVMPSTDTDPYIEMADSVIAELQLHPVETLDRRYLRYATRWRNNPAWKPND